MLQESANHCQIEGRPQPCSASGVQRVPLTRAFSRLTEMSEGALYLLSQRLRLLARHQVQVTRDGDYLVGRIRPGFEAAFRRTSRLLDLVVDGDQLTNADLRWLRRAQARTQLLRRHVRELEQSVT